MRNKNYPFKWGGLKCTFDGKSLDFGFGIIVPAEMIVCPSCDGRGTTVSHIEPDGGGFTSTEWAEACADDPDFAEDYMSGLYDRNCPDCNGKNVIASPKHPWPDDLCRLMHDYNCARAEEEAERRVGA